MNDDGLRAGQPIVSTIIPVFNGAGYLEEAISSVLEQSFQSIEIIVVDDGSTDQTAQIAKTFVPPVIYTFQQNQGSSAARNRGVHLARGRFLAFLDADDVWSADKIQVQMQYMRDHPGIDVVFGHVKQFVSPDIEQDLSNAISVSTTDVPGHVPGTMLVTREAFHRVGFFDTTLDLAETIEWYARALDAGVTTHMLPVTVMRRRIHKTNKGIISSADRGDYARALKTILDRRRRSGQGPHVMDK